ncbi:MAG: hypothetical protein M3R49_00780 [Chloroflexota bacterium]|nr:hypothetical protein [Chloroflexota bacterium]
MRFCVACAYDFWGAAAGRPEEMAVLVVAGPDSASASSSYGPVPRAVRAVIGGGALVAVGSLLPWITTSSIDGTWGAFSGVQGGGDGWISLAVGAGIAALAIMGKQGASEFNRAAVGLLSLVALLVFWINLGRVGAAAAAFDRQSFGYATASVSVGLWLIAIGALLAFAFNVVRAARTGPGTLPSILPWR